APAVQDGSKTQREPAKPSAEAAKARLTPRKAPVLRKAADKPVAASADKPAPPVVPASLTKAKPLVAAGDDSDWETF
ncbi:MAG: methyl-accepting chemotaxis protein, partial [Ralstonia mannitolilytica]